MVIYRDRIVKDLENLFQICINQEAELLKNYDQNDLRVTFFKHLNNTIDASIHLMILMDKHFRKPDDFMTWRKNHEKYKIKERRWYNVAYKNYVIDLDYTDEYLLNSYFTFIFHTFEYAFRSIFIKLFPDEYFNIKNDKKTPKSFGNLWEQFVKTTELKNDNTRKNFKTIVFNFRNSMHTNGVFVSPSGTSSKIPWNNDIYPFNHEKRIEKDDLWIHYIAFTREFIYIFNDIMRLKELQDEAYIKDTTEPTD